MEGWEKGKGREVNGGEKGERLMVVKTERLMVGERERG